MTKVLLITYYWPPAGGAGVQRWVKLTKYLTRLGVECHVLTVDPEKSSYQEWDETMVSEIEPQVKVYKTNSFEPTNIYASLAGKNKVPTSGFSNVDNTKFSQKIVNAIRSNFFIPDPRIGWKPYGYKQAKKIIKQHDISLVITTSPPHSVQMIGLRLKRTFKNIKWIVDINDPWTDIYYYKLLNHSFISHRINIFFEKAVLEKSDKIVTVSKGFKELFLSKNYNIKNGIEIITNGYDSEDFENVFSTKSVNDNYINIVYTGTVSHQYNPYTLFQALRELERETSKRFKITFVGKVDDKIIYYLKDNKITYDYVGYVPHSEVTSYQIEADILLLLIPQIELSNGIIPGKIFEYIATKKPILCIGNKGGDVESILEELNGSAIFGYEDLAEMKQFLHFFSKNVNRVSSATAKYTREYQAKQYYKLITNE